MQTHYISERILLDKLKLSDHEFIFELVSFHDFVLLRYKFGHVPSDVDVATA